MVVAVTTTRQTGMLAVAGSDAGASDRRPASSAHHHAVTDARYDALTMA